MDQASEIIELRPEHLAQVENWVGSQHASKALLKQPGTALSPASDMFGWATVQAGEVLAVAIVKLNKEHVGYLECRVKPSAGRQGLGSELVDYVLRQPAVEALAHLHAVVAPDNTAARKILNAEGFSRTGYAADGRIEFARHKA